MSCKIEWKTKFVVDFRQDFGVLEHAPSVKFIRTDIH
jgi:hypothetical protein